MHRPICALGPTAPILALASASAWRLSHPLFISHQRNEAALCPALPLFCPSPHPTPPNCTMHWSPASSSSEFIPAIHKKKAKLVLSGSFAHCCLFVCLPTPFSLDHAHTHILPATTLLPTRTCRTPCPWCCLLHAPSSAGPPHPSLPCMHAHAGSVRRVSAAGPPPKNSQQCSENVRAQIPPRLPRPALAPIRQGSVSVSHLSLQVRTLAPCACAHTHTHTLVHCTQLSLQPHRTHTMPRTQWDDLNFESCSAARCWPIDQDFSPSHPPS